MARNIFHCIMFDYNGMTYMSEINCRRKLTVSDLLNSFDKIIHEDRFLSYPIQRLELTIDHEIVYSADVYRPGH